MNLSFFEKMASLEYKISSLQQQFEKNQQQWEQSFNRLKNQFIRLKNGEKISDKVLSQSVYYVDLSPQEALQFISSPSFQFQILDVSSSNYATLSNIKVDYKIPLEHLYARACEITSPHLPLLVISENGLKSIFACDYLSSCNFFNLYNISGGYHCWPEKLSSTPPSSTSNSTSLKREAA